MMKSRFIKIRSRLKILFKIFKKALYRFHADQGYLISNGLAFKTLLAFAPVLVIIVYLFKLIPLLSDYKLKLIDFLRDFIVPSSLELVMSWINIIFEKTGTISIISIFVFIYFILELLITLNNQIDRIWTIKFKRPIIWKILKYWMLLTTMPIILAGYFYYSGFIRSLLKVLPFNNTSFLDNIIYYLVTIIIITFFFFIIYYIIPTSKVSLKKSVAVSFSVALIWLILRFIFTYYTVLLIEKWSFVFGSFISLLIFVIWTSINWMVVLFGVEFLSVWQNKLYIENVSFDKIFLFDIGFLLLILSEFYYDFKKYGKGLSPSQIAEKTDYNQNDINKIIYLLEEEGFIISDNKVMQKYYLKRDVSSVKLADLENIIWKRLIKNENSTSERIKKICNKLGNYYLKRKKANAVFLDEFIID